MYPLRLRQIATLLQGKIIRGNPDLVLTNVYYRRGRHINARTLFFFYDSRGRKRPDLRDLSPGAVVTSRDLLPLVPARLPVIVVNNPFRALWKLARWQRNQLAIPVIGITGSAGKSTTTAMTAAILSRVHPTLHTVGNLNTTTWFPFQMLRVSPRHRAVVFEMGMNRLGDIRQHSRAARPSIAVITNIGEAHVGNLGNTLDNVVRAKQEIIEGLSPTGTLVLNADDERSRRIDTRKVRGRVVTFGIRNPADYRAKDVRYTLTGMRFTVALRGANHTFHLPVFGEHMVYNALAAIAVADLLGISPAAMREGLRRFRPPKMRLQMIRGKQGRLLINDAYNANPSAMIAGLSILPHLPHKGKRIAVLGDMMELGTLTHSGHRRVGRYIAAHRPVDVLVTVGRYGRIIAEAARERGFGPVYTFPTREDALKYLLKTPPGSVLYFKASRRLCFERLLRPLRKDER